MSEINKNRGRRFSRVELKNNFFNESLGSNSINHLTSRKTTKVYFDDYKKKENDSPEKGKIPLYNKNILNISSLIFAAYPGQSQIKKHNKNYIRILNDLKKLLPLFVTNKKIHTYKSQRTLQEQIDVNKNTPLDITLGVHENKVNIKEAKQIFNKLPEERTFEDLSKLIKYLSNTKFCRNFLKENLTNESVDKMLVFCGAEMKMKEYPENTIVFKIGDNPDNFYLILTGEIEILKPVKYQKIMNGYEYFYHLMQLRKKEETYMYNLTISENQNSFPIKVPDINNIHWIYINIMLNLIYTGMIINFEEVLELCGVTQDKLGIKNQIDDNLQLIPYLLYNRDIISRIIPGFPDETLHFYSYLKANILPENNKKKQVSLFEYKVFLILEEGLHFGDMALDAKTTRNATIRTSSETTLLYIDATLYGENLAKEKQIIAIKEISFLQQSFFFSEMNFQVFEKKYYNFFILEDKIQGEIVCNENDNVNEIYFIRKGVISLYSTKSPIEIHKFLNKLDKNNPKNQMNKNTHYSTLKSNIRDLQKELFMKKSQRLFDINDCEIIGIESYFFNLPCFVTAIVKSKKAKVIKISVEHLSKIFEEDHKSLKKAKALASEKIQMWYNRFFNINNTNIATIDNRNFYIEKERISKIEKEYQSQERFKLIQQRNGNEDLAIKKKRRYEKNNSVLIPSKKVVVNCNKLILLPSLVKDKKNFLKDTKSQSYSKIKSTSSLSTSFDGISDVFFRQNRKYKLEQNEKPKKQDSSKLVSTVFEKQLLQKLKDDSSYFHIGSDINDDSLNKIPSAKSIHYRSNIPIRGVERKKKMFSLKRTLLYKSPYVSPETKKKLSQYEIFNCSQSRSNKGNTKSIDETFEKIFNFSYNINPIHKTMIDSLAANKKIKNSIFKKHQSYQKYKKVIVPKLKGDIIDLKNESLKN